MYFGTGLALFFLAFFLFIACAFCFQRLRWKRRKRLGRKLLGFYPGSTSLGNALQNLQLFVQPRMGYVIEEKLKEDEDADDSGDPDSAEKQLLRQARRIQRGESIDRLIVSVRWRR